MSRTCLAGLVLFAALPLAEARGAINFVAVLTGDQEVLTPPVVTTASGFATLVLNDAQDKLIMNITVTGLDFGDVTPAANDNQTADEGDDVQAAHIHVGAAPGTNAPVRWGFIGTPFHNTDNDLVLTPFATGVGATLFAEWDLAEGNPAPQPAGTPNPLAIHLPDILAGRSYLNFHTIEYPGGEIRGQILQAPEPASMVLWGVGALGTVLAYRRRRRAA